MRSTVRASRPRSGTIASMLALLILTLPLSGCALVDALLGKVQTRTVVRTVCPDSDKTAQLAPPETVLGRLQTPEERTWADVLDKHLEKLEAC